MNQLSKAIENVGGVSRLAEILGISSSAPSMWKARGRVPPEYCPGIERATEGAVTCEALRPDVHWFRVKDRRWPNPAGRPLVDHAHKAAA